MHKIPVGILGATGMVGQKFIELLSSHPWFEIIALGASDRSAHKLFKDSMSWMMLNPLSEVIASMQVLPCHIEHFPCKLVFSGLDSQIAGPIEASFAQAGYTVISNSSYHRMASHVPLIIPEVNSDHLQLLHHQSSHKGYIVTNPNCSVIGICMALKPLLDRWGITAAYINTMQAISGAGYPGVASLDILDNVIPYISGEEDKVETEPLKILGSYIEGEIKNCDINISSHCNRVPVSDGHLASISVKFKEPALYEDILDAWMTFKSEPQSLNLPTAPKQPLIYLDNEKFPQPKLHRLYEKGMGVSIGRLRKCSILDWKFVVLSHNTVRGAAGCAILNAELMLKKGLLFRSPLQTDSLAFSI